MAHEAPKHDLISRNGKLLGYEVFNEAIETLKPGLYMFTWNLESSR